MREVVQVAPSKLGGIEISIERARSLFNEGDVVKARIVADAAYAQAKTEAEFATRNRCAKHLIDKARRLMADALIIEQTSMVAIASMIDELQAKGTVQKAGRPSSSAFKMAEIGVNGARLHEARKLAMVALARPETIKIAIESSLNAGKRPTRTALYRDLGIERRRKRPNIGLPGIPSLEKLHWYELPEAIREASRALAVLQRVYAHVQPDDHNLRVGDLIGSAALASLVEGE